jgi:hypothetical protein
VRTWADHAWPEFRTGPLFCLRLAPACLPAVGTRMLKKLMRILRPSLEFTQQQPTRIRLIQAEKQSHSAHKIKVDLRWRHANRIHPGRRPDGRLRDADFDLVNYRLSALG